MSASLIAVFIPILFMPGLTGRLFREFAVTLAAAIAVSLVESLTTTLMLASRLLRTRSASRPGGFASWAARGFEATKESYAHSLAWSLSPSSLIGLLSIA